MINKDNFNKYYDQLLELLKRPTDLADTACAFWEGTLEIISFAETVFVPVLKGILKASKREIALRDTYLRMCLWLSGMAKLDSPMYFQQAAVSTRSLFELLLDMKTLANDQVGTKVDRFHAFPRVEKYKRAKATIVFFDQHPDLASPDLDKERIFLRHPSNSDKEIDKIKKAHWGCNRKTGKPKSPIHWTGRDTRMRARGLGLKYEQFYVETYHWLSWYVHPGSTGYEGFDKNSLKAVFGLAHTLAHSLFLEATLICADEFKLAKLDNLKAPLHKIVEQLRMKPGEVLIQKEIEMLKQLSQQSKNNDSN